MTKRTSTTLAAFILASTASFATAQEFNLELEGLHLTPSITDGFGQDDADNNVELGAETSIRAKAGYTFANGTGFRLQFWDMDTNYDDGQDGDPSEVQLQQIDLIGYRTFEIAPGLDLEVSGGVRKLDLNDVNFTEDREDRTFDGVGAVFGTKATQAVIKDGSIYASFESAVLFGDLKSEDDGDIDEFLNSNLGQTTIGLGYEHDFPLGATTTTLKVGYEATRFSGIEDNRDGGFGFDGFVLGAAISF